MTNLWKHIQLTPIIDTHEHLYKEADLVNNGPDVLQDLFGHYAGHDLIAAGATEEVMEHLLDDANPDIESRWNGVSEAWQQCQFTGYGTAVRSLAKHVYGMDEITVAGIEAAAEHNRKLRQPGERLRILKEEGNIDHVQIDDFVFSCLPDESGLDFFLYDINWVDFCNGEINVKWVHEETGITITDLSSLDAAMQAIFAKYGACAIAIKTQHAYRRTLLWQKRDKAEVAAALDKLLQGKDLTGVEQLCLGDWGLARGVELATEHNLPVKMHTGYFAGNNVMPLDNTRPAHVSGLLQHYPGARFVLMHAGYPYGPELIALAKHYSNVYVDLCWAWSMDPFSVADFLRRYIHAAPINKLFGFGGDTFWPNMSVAYAKQARFWLNRALQAEIDEGFMTEKQAIVLATKFMRGNQESLFDLQGTRAAIHAAVTPK